MKLNNEITQTTTMKKLLYHRKGLSIMLILLLNALFFAKQSVAQTVVLNPTSPFVIPAGVISVKIEVWGGGGAGGGASASLGSNIGSGGGGGAYNVANFTVIAGQSYTIVRGTGGTGVSGGNGNAGTLSSVTGPGGTVSVNPGLGGTKDGGAFGAGGTGGFNNGGNGGTATSNGAGGGGGAGNATPTGTGNGGNGSNTAAGTGGIGSPNVAPYIGGIGGASQNSNSNNGNAGTAPGGGGGGAKLSFSTAKTGGAGTAGQVVITYTVCTPPAAPIVITPINYCLNSTAIPLTATGSGLLWYTVSTGGTGSSTAPTPLTTTTGSTAYYVSQTVGCEGARELIKVIVNALPVSSVTGQTNINCFNTNDGTITVSATGGTGPYTFSVDNGTNFLAPTGTDLRLFSGLLPNNPYRIKVRDNNQCISK